MFAHMNVLDTTCCKLGFGIIESILINFKKTLEVLPTCLKSIKCFRIKDILHICVHGGFVIHPPSPLMVVLIVLFISV